MVPPKKNILFYFHGVWRGEFALPDKGPWFFNTILYDVVGYRSFTISLLRTGFV